MNKTIKAKVLSYSHIHFRSVITISFAIVFYSLYSFSSWATEFIPWRIEVGLGWDRVVPFLPWTAIIYLSMTALLLLPLVLIKEKEKLYQFASLLIIQTFIGCAFFLLLPAVNDFPVRLGEGIFYEVFLIADAVNLSHNNLPSLHVCFALTAAIFLSRNTGNQNLYYFWAFSIIVSTITIHEHGIIDIVFGILLSMLTYSRLTKVGD